MTTLSMNKNETLQSKKDFAKARFKKLMDKDRKTMLVLCQDSEGQDFLVFVNNSCEEEVIDAEINLIDADNVCYMHSKDTHSFNALYVHFVSENKLLLGYALPDTDKDRFCCWGYKNHNATTEKICVYFKTTVVSYLAYFDGQHPEHCFMLESGTTEDHNNIENLFCFIKSLKGSFEDHETI